MSDSSCQESQRSRAELLALLTGAENREGLTRAEARARLRALDPGVDLSPLLHSLRSGDPREALAALAAELSLAAALPVLQRRLTNGLLELLKQGLG
ncbi:hypothetical protein [Desulfogranum mediterraneum]|uniref:hypothetical protein n=1 Tax=Desulfogranum mediterraneum TaxID=160661 RepID=UPI00042378A6|nr:hypothetical protein [Desulfogranum mediterraneum]